ncbi:MAG: hypothetical protein AAFS01_05470 [Pseudomonadota bacterium]
MATYRPITLGAAYAVRIEDLTTGDAVQVTCRACDHVAFVSAETLKATIRPTFRIVAIERNFRCRHCGTRGNVGWHTVRKAMI